MRTHPTPDDHPGAPGDISYTGHAVLDEHGIPIGSVTDVVYDRHGFAPEYLVVDPGIFRAAHYVPVEGCYLTNDDRLVVPWDRHWVKSGPKATGDHVLTSIDRRSLEVHYATV